MQDRNAKSLPQTWDAASLGEVPTQDYSEVMATEDGLYSWLSTLNRVGIVILKGAPKVEEEVIRLAQRVAEPYRTVYGRHFDVQPVQDPLNLAYSTLSIPLHQDILYYESSPGIQLLHCMEFDSTLNGGSNYFVDSFRAAQHLEEEHPEHYAFLASHPANWVKHDSLCDLVQRRTHIVLDAQKQLVGIHWSPPWEGVIELPPSQMKPYVAAYKALYDAINKEELRLEWRLQPGEVATFNNRRILHSRHGFEGSGQRKLQGTYLTVDDTWSTLRILQKKRQLSTRDVYRSGGMGWAA